MSRISKNRLRLQLVVLTALFAIGIGCTAAEAARPTSPPEPTAEPETATTPAASSSDGAETSASTETPEPAEEPASAPTVDPYHPSNFTPEQIEAATQRANCLKDQGISQETVQSLARGQLVDITPELAAAANACGIKQTITSEPQTDNPVTLNLTPEQAACLFGSLGEDVFSELMAGGEPEVGAYDPIIALEECGIDLEEILPAYQ